MVRRRPCGKLSTTAWWLSSGWIWSLHSPVFNFSLFFFLFSPLKQIRCSSLFLFCLPKKIKRINFHLKLKIHNPRTRSSSLKITQISPLSHFSQSPRANWPHLSELAEAKTHTYIYNMGEIQNWHFSMVEDY